MATAYIDKYTGTASSVSLPRSVVKGGMTYTVTTINKVFENNTTVRSVTLPSTVTALNGTFMGFTNLGKVGLPSGLTSLGEDTFRGCTALSEMTIPSKVTSIGANAFAGCSKLAKVSFPKSLTSIGNGAFTGTALTQIEYAGTKEEWNTLMASCGSGNPELTQLTPASSDSAEETDSSETVSGNSAG